MNIILPTLEQFKSEAKVLNRQDSSIKNHSHALDKRAEHYGFRDWQAIQPHLCSEVHKRMPITVIKWQNPFKGEPSGVEGVEITRTIDIFVRTREIYDSIDWKKIKNTKIVSEDFDKESRTIALLNIRGEEYRLMNYDYYLLLAVALSDGFDVEHGFVYDLRTAMREDINHFVGPLLDTLFSYPFYNLEALKVFNKFYNDYMGDINIELFDIEVYVYRLKTILKKLNIDKSD